MTFLDPEDDNTRRQLLALGIDARAAEVYIEWRNTSRAATTAAVATVGKSARRLPRVVLAVVRCPAQGHELANIYRVAEGPLLWPTTAAPPTRDEVIREKGQAEDDPREYLGPRNGAPGIGGHYMRARGRRPNLTVPPEAALLTVPAVLAERFNWRADLWCRCGRHVVIILP